MRFTPEEQGKFRLKPGDLLVCEGGEVGRTAVWDGEVEECYFQKAIHRLRPKGDVEPRFVLHYMRRAAEAGQFAQLTSSTSIAHLTKTKLARLLLPLPPLEEQKRIAAILDAADALRAKRRESIAQLDALLQSTFLHMFGDPVTNPMGWSVCSLEKASLGIVDGPFGSNLKTSDYVASGVPVLQGKNISGDRFRWFDIRFVTPAKAASLKRSAVVEGDHLLIKIGSIGYSAILDDLRGCDHAIIPANMARIRRNHDLVDQAYLHGFLTSGRMADVFRGLASKTAQPALSLKKIKAVRIPLPPLERQRKYAEIVAAAERQKDRYCLHLHQLDALFGSLRHRAFNGELEVV